MSKKKSSYPVEYVEIMAIFKEAILNYAEKFFSNTNEYEYKKISLVEVLRKALGIHTGNNNDKHKMPYSRGVFKNLRDTNSLKKLNKILKINNIENIESTKNETPNKID